MGVHATSGSVWKHASGGHPRGASHRYLGRRYASNGCARDIGMRMEACLGRAPAQRVTPVFRTKVCLRRACVKPVSRMEACIQRRARARRGASISRTQACLQNTRTVFETGFPRAPARRVAPAFSMNACIQRVRAPCAEACLQRAGGTRAARRTGIQYERAAHCTA